MVSDQASGETQEACAKFFALPVAPTNAIGRMSISSNTVDAATIYSYDPVGRVVQQNTCLPDNSSFQMTQHATYDLTGNVTSLTYPDGRVVTQGLDAAGHLQSVIFDNYNGQHIGYTYAAGLTYTPSGAQAEMTLGNGVYIHTPYNNRQQMCQVWSKSPRSLRICVEINTPSPLIRSPLASQRREFGLAVAFYP
jgi:YD repeat-containing protein